MVFALLSEWGRRLWNFLLGLVREKVEPVIAWAKWREFYPRYELSDFTSDVELIRIVYEESEKMRYYRRDYVIGSERYMPALMSGRSRYKTVMRVTYRDPITGETMTEYGVVEHNRTMTRGELERMLLERMERAGYRMVDAVVTPMHGFHDYNYPGEVPFW